MSHNSMKILKATPEMADQDEIFSNLPPEIIPNILSRIPIKTICSWKCVCKSWLKLLESPEFAQSHLSNSVPGLLIHLATKEETNIFKIFEFEDSSPEIESHQLHYKKVLELEMVEIFNLSDGSGIEVEGSANGLLFLLDIACQPSDHYVCNPITHEYIKLPKPEGNHQNGTVGTYGFGVSRSSNQYKVVRIFQYRMHDPDDTDWLLKIPERICQVYTLGTESWRCVIATPCEMLDYGWSGAFSRLLNGNLYWLARDLTGSRWISCFDIETEVFTKFRAPTVESEGSQMDVGVLRDRLCLCDNSSDTEVSIYMMSDYGDEDRSWNKEYVISKIPGYVPQTFAGAYALKAFGDGDLLMALQNNYLFCYCNRTKTMAPVGLFNGAAFHFLDAILYTPSFISLKDFETKK